jgi:hypothetical protein
MPVVCFVFDPFVFKGGLGALDSAIFAGYRPFAYLLSLACVLSMTAWLIWAEKLRWLSGFFAGLFFLGGAISLAVGIVLFPFSFIGLIILIGVLGFTPLLTAVIYLRNAFRALHASKMFLVKPVRVYAFGFGVIFSASLAWAINGEIRKALANIERGDAPAIRAEARKLKYATLLFDADRLVVIYTYSENQNEKRQALADAYRDLTGEEIEGKKVNTWD